MYILSVLADDEHFKPGNIYKIIKIEGEKYVTILDERGHELHVSRNCTPMKDGRIQLINKKGNLSLF